MNKTDQRSIIAVILCFVFYLAYSQYLSNRYPKTQTPQGTAQTAATTTTVPPAAANTTVATVPALPGAAPQEAVVQLSPQDLRIETDRATYTFSQDIGGIASLTLRDYKSGNQKDSGPVDLVDGALAMQATTDLKSMTPVHGGYHAERHGQTIRFWRDAGDFRLSQEFNIPERGFGGSVKVSFTNISGKDTELNGGLLLNEVIRPKPSPSLLAMFMPGASNAPSSGSSRQREQLVYSVDGSTDWTDIEKYCKDDKEASKYDGVPVQYVGFDRHYFMSVVAPKAKTGSLRISHGEPTEAGCPLSFLNFDHQGLVKAGDTFSLDYTTYAGPKDITILEAYDPALQSAMHLGVFGFIAKPLLFVIEGFEQVTKNYGLAIILLTLCLKLLFFPLVRASAISMHRMKKLNPQMALIKEKFKDDKAKQQQALMKFMSDNKVNPMKGCLPVLPQIPVFFAFYQVLQTSIHLRHAPFALWIQDLSAMDPYFVTPLLMGVAMFLQQKLTPTSGMDKTQEKILMLMPIMFTVMMLTLPAGLTLYMLTNTVVGILQQKWLYRRLDRLEPSMP